MITATIKKAKGDTSEALWLFIDRKPDRTTTADELKDLFGIRDEDEGNVAYAILESEVEVVRDACNKYLEGEE